MQLKHNILGLLCAHHSHVSILLTSSRFSLACNQQWDYSLPPMLLLLAVCQLWSNQLKITYTHCKYLEGSAAYLRTDTQFSDFHSIQRWIKLPVDGQRSDHIDINNEQNDTEKKCISLIIKISLKVILFVIIGILRYYIFNNNIE